MEKLKVLYIMMYSAIVVACTQDNTIQLNNCSLVGTISRCPATILLEYLEKDIGVQKIIAGGECCEFEINSLPPGKYKIEVLIDGYDLSAIVLMTPSRPTIRDGIIELTNNQVVDIHIFLK